MIDHLSPITEGIKKAIQAIYGVDVNDQISLQETKKEFDGDFTLVVFPFTRALRRKPEEIAESIGQWLLDSESYPIHSYNVVKGFLNLELSNAFWQKAMTDLSAQDVLISQVATADKVLVEFSSPNTNKPLHLGHIRNILLGWSTSQILKAVGHDVHNTQIINNRGIAICKSMLAWQKFGNGETPESSGVKGDHFVGKYYIEFEKRFREEYGAWQESDQGKATYDAKKKEDQSEEAFFKAFKNTYFNEHSDLGAAAKQMLLDWEAGDEKTVALWNQMNSWVYEGFDVTYDALGVSFDSLYYESDTYLLGKDLTDKGLQDKKFYQKEDGSVWVDLEPAGLDHKLLLRSDGTSVYMTQDLGTAQKRYEDHKASRMIYVVADEQDYHFQVLFEIMKLLGAPYADGMYHLSYGMVDLPSGRMKSREGTVVDADDLIKEVIDEVRSAAKERGELEEVSGTDREEIYRRVGLAALKFFILKVNPKKRMVFNPAESVDMQGQTGPYIQNAYVRIQSIMRRLSSEVMNDASSYTSYDPTEIDLIKSLMEYDGQVHASAQNYDPSVVATYAYELAKKFHKFYHDVRILKAESESAKSFRLQLSTRVAMVLEHAMLLLGVEMPERM